MKAQPTKKTIQTLQEIHRKLTKVDSLITIMRRSYDDGGNAPLVEGYATLLKQAQRNLGVFDDLSDLEEILGIDKPLFSYEFDEESNVIYDDKPAAESSQEQEGQEYNKLPPSNVRGSEKLKQPPLDYEQRRRLGDMLHDLDDMANGLKKLGPEIGEAFTQTLDSSREFLHGVTVEGVGHKTEDLVTKIQVMLDEVGLGYPSGVDPDSSEEEAK